MVDCLFCKIISGEIPSDKVFGDELFFAFRDINPQAKTHILIVPKKHIEMLTQCSENDKEMLSGLLLTANKVAKDLDVANSGFRVTINSGENGGQLVFHLHLHLIGGEKLSDKIA